MDNSSAVMVKEPGTSTRQCLGNLEDVPPGQGLCYVLASGEEVAVFKQRNGQIFATQNRCPHLGGPLSEGMTGNGRVICPLHARSYDLKSGNGAHGDCVHTYPVSVEGGRIFVTETEPAAACC